MIGIVESPKGPHACFISLKISLKMINDARVYFQLTIKEGIEAFDTSNCSEQDPYNHLLSTIAALKDHADGFSIVIQVIDAPLMNSATLTIRRLEFFMQSLTKRELEVYNLAMRGFSNRLIAEKLFITAETVKTQRKNIVGKAGVRSIEELKSRLLEANKLIEK